MKNNSKISQQIFWMIFVMIIGILMFVQLSEIATHAGNWRSNSLMIVVDEQLEEWGVIGILTLVAGCYCVGIQNYLQSKHAPHLKNPQRDQNLKMYLTLNFHHLIFGCDKTVIIQHLEPIKNGKVAPKARELTFTIPPGIHAGVSFLLIGEGDARPDGATGDLLIAFENLPAESDGLIREGSNIISVLQVTTAQAQQGDRVSIQTINGVSDVIIPSGTKHGDRLVIQDRGLPVYNDRECFQFLAGTCRGNSKNVIKQMGLNILSSRSRGDHLVCIDISDPHL